MASNERRLMKRIITTRVEKYTVKVPIPKTSTSRFDRKVQPEFRVEERTRIVPAYEYGIFEASGVYGDRTLTAIVEAPKFADAIGILRAPRTESGHSFKGFKKLKTA